MELHEIMKSKFDSLDKAALRTVIVAMSSDPYFVEWFDEMWPAPWHKVTFHWLTRFARPFLSGADLSGADLGCANFTQADLNGANLSGANLNGAYLLSADLYGANLSGADLSGAYLRQANLQEANLSGAFWDGITRWPEGFTPPE